MRYLLNSAVITAAGSYDYRLINADEARAWMRRGNWVSTIGYAETAQALGELTGTTVPVDRKVIKMSPGDESLVFRLVLPPGERRVDPAAKGGMGADFIRAHCELGILTRVR